MTETSPQRDRPGGPEDGQGQPRKPRGLGGIVLILALLMALFLVVARSGTDADASVDLFYKRLLNGQVTNVDWRGNVAAVRFRDENGQIRGAEVVLEDFKEEIPLLKRVQAYHGDRFDGLRYAETGLDGLRKDVESGEVTVKEAFFVTEVPKAAEGEGPPATISYVTALIQDGQQEGYIRADHKSQGMTLQALRNELVRVLPRDRVYDKTIDLDPASFRFSQTNNALMYLLGSLLPWILVLGIVWFFIIRQMRSPGGSGGVLSFGRSRAALYTKENRTNVTFEDVAGMEESKGEVKEIIEFLKNPGKFAKLGGSIPRGVLLVGAPGTGKTLLAKAIAGEAEVPFFSISGSDFVEMFVGVGASRVRDLFKQAREASPCIVFLDEIDAVGRKRGSGMGGGHDEREQTLNAILVEMDGFDSDKGIILVGATNRPDVLDPALLRPGRFDRQVTIDMPDVKGREQILKVHARKVKMSAAVELSRVAKATVGFSGAELAAVVNEAAILAAMRGKDQVEASELEEARDRVRYGREKRSRAIEDEDRKVTAYHEAGHALVSSLIPDQDPVHKVTIVSRGRALGAVMSFPEKDHYNHWRSKLLGRIAVCFGGRIAEDVVFNDISAGAQNDIEQATNLARAMVCELGMSEKVGPVRYTADTENPFLGSEFRMSGDISQATMELIDGEVRQLIEQGYDKAKELIVTNRHKLDEIAQALLKHETLSGDELAAILRGDDLEKFQAARKRHEQEIEQAARAAAAKRAAEEAAQERAREEAANNGNDLPGAEGLAQS